MAVAQLILKIISAPFWLSAALMKCGPHVTRYYMYAELAGATGSVNGGAGKKVISISHSTDLVKILGLDQAEIVEANYPEHNALDLRAFQDGEFDFIVSDQVLEHVEGNPQLVFDESFRLLKPGGIAVHTTCFINPIHGWPSDFWRFTPAALQLLARNYRKIVKVGGFGNPLVWVVVALGMRETQVPHAKWHPLHMVATINHRNWPVATWIVAQK
jgi:SAM-dependent methyltransferase